MVRFGTDNVADSMGLGKEASEYVSTQFPLPIKLEFEKVAVQFRLVPWRADMIDNCVKYFKVACT